MMMPMALLVTLALSCASTQAFIVIPHVTHRGMTKDALQRLVAQKSGIPLQKQSLSRFDARCVGSSLSMAKTAGMETDIAEEVDRLNSVPNHAQKDKITYYDSEEDTIKTVDRQTSGTKDGDTAPKDLSLFDVLYVMLNISNLIYTFAALRAIITGKITLYEPGWGPWPLSSWTRQAVPATNVTRADLVYTQNDTGGGRRASEVNGYTYLKREIPIQDMATFVQENFELFEKAPIPEINTKKGDAMNTLDILDKAKTFADDAYIYEFDDEFAQTQLVYSIFVNPDEERVTVIFRGSVTGDDWATNLDAKLTTLNTPEYLRQQGFDETIMVHHGFKTYLIDETPAGDSEERKYKRIIANLEDVFAKYPTYELFITGHSLGGALCSLLAFKIAGSDPTKVLPMVKRPIRAVTFAAPQVGSDVYNQAYQVLEKNNMVRLLRVSNQDDIIPVMPPFPPNLGQFMDRYSQNGVNIHLKRRNEELQFGYRNLKNLPSQISLKSGEFHGLNVYLRRIMKDQNLAILKSVKFEEFFDDYALVPGLQQLYAVPMPGPVETE